MADEATAGNDQQDESQTGEDQQAGETQQEEGSVADPKDEQITRLEQEVERANAFAKTVQNQLHDAKQGVEEQTDEELSVAGYTPQQIKEARALTGTDKLEQELKALREEREQEKLQRQNQEYQSKVDALQKEFPAKDGFPKVDAQELVRHGQVIGTINPRLAYLDKYEAVIYDKKVEAAKPKAPVSDRSDSDENPKLSKKDYEEKLWALRNSPQERSEFMMKHGSVVPE